MWWKMEGHTIDSRKAVSRHEWSRRVFAEYGYADYVLPNDEVRNGAGMLENVLMCEI